MRNPILPRSADNRYRGHPAALWLFALLVLSKAVMSTNSILNGRTVASSADGIPLDRFGPSGAQAVLSLFAIWGIAHLTICALCLLVLVRYRVLVPLLFALLLLEQLGRRLILWFLPIPRTGASPGFAVNLFLLAITIVGLALSLWSREPLQAPDDGGVPAKRD